jgi:TatD DNase family protein
MPRLIDSHCHLTYPGLIEQIDGVLARAAAAGVEDIVTIATDAADAAKSLAIAANHPCVHVVAGVHPHNAAKVADGWETHLRSIVSRSDVHAVGEMGLDYHYDFADRTVQDRVFRAQLAIAQSTHKPVVIHCRESHDDVLRVLADFPNLACVVFHCFTGSMTEARQIIEAGYWISLTGVVTFKKSDELREVARFIPADRLMIETDAPYLSPEPLRNSRPNEPSYLIHTARCVADARGLSVEELADLTTTNARRFFKLHLPAS